MWSKNPIGKLIIFVHGFGGSPKSTWGKFPRYISGLHKYKGYDIILYGYDSIHTQADPSGIELYTFISDIYNDRAGYQDEGVQYSYRELKIVKSRLRFTDLTLIAHSLGAVICRRGLLEGYKQRQSWVPGTTLLLFAPAHLGARKAVMAEQSFFPRIFQLMLYSMKLKMAIIDDLHQDSKAIKAIYDETKKIQDKENEFFGAAKAVVWAKKDLVVINGVFLNDATPINISGQSHSTVCKPHETYQDPIQIAGKHI